MNAIELKNVNFSYDGKVNILENVNIALNSGEVNLVPVIRAKEKARFCIS